MSDTELGAKVTCRCGHDAKHFLVSEEAEYSLIGWVGVCLGISVRPKLLKYRCRTCDTVFLRTTDPKALEQHY